MYTLSCLIITFQIQIKILLLLLVSNNLFFIRLAIWYTVFHVMMFMFSYISVILSSLDADSSLFSGQALLDFPPQCCDWLPLNFP